MDRAVRIAIYFVLIAVASFFGQRFMAGYNRGADAAATRLGAEEPPAVVEATNTAPSDAGEPAEPTPESAATEAATNAWPDGSTNVAAAAPPKVPVPTQPAVAGGKRPTSGPPLGWYGALSLLSVLMLGLLVAHDLSHFVASRAQRELYNEEGEGFADPEYDQAEQVWANGEHLEAIRLMREYFAAHPREIHVVFRIAEIYERDLSNNLAAALEYEEILTHHLSRDRWGWAAIHLCNLYNRLNQPDKAEALLRRIVVEYGDTPAAQKAREHLGLPPDDGSGAAGGETTAGGLKLPPGFRPKKR